MADLTAPDRNAYWGGLVDALRKIRSSVANVPEPEIKNLAVPDSWSAKDILNEGVLPSEDSIGEYENYAYGNYPIEQNPRTGLPRFKSDREGSRAGRAVGAAADLPLAAVTTPAKALGLAAGKASPAILAAIKKAAFKGMDVADYDRRINLAEEILAKGGSHQDVWDTVKLTEGYRPGIEGLDPWKGKWSTEFSPTEAMRGGEL